MQTKTTKRRTRLSWYDNQPKRAKRKQLETVSSSPAAKAVKPDVRPILIYGRDTAGKIVAEDKAAEHWKAKQIADGWRSSGFAVEIIETGVPDRPNSAGAGSRVAPSGDIFGASCATAGGEIGRRVAESQ